MKGKIMGLKEEAEKNIGISIPDDEWFRYVRSVSNDTPYGNVHDEAMRYFETRDETSLSDFSKQYLLAYSDSIPSLMKMSKEIGGNKMKDMIIKNKDFKALSDAAKSGNQKALGILEKYQSKDGSLNQESLDKLIEEFYLPESEPISEQQETAPAEEEIPNPIKDEPEEPEPISLGVSVVEPITSHLEYSESPDSLASDKPLPTVDISKMLDDDLEGLIDKLDIPEMSFRDFISNKKKDGLRAKKNHDHFSTYDADGRANYLTSKTDEYSHSFDNKRKDNDRKFRDMDGAISAYIFSVNGLPDDGSEMDDAKVSELYNKITDDDSIMGAFGRSWDADDDAAMKATLETLVQEYGKANVIAVLNSLKSDNGAYHDFRNGQIDQETKRYGKSLEELLK